MTTKKEFVTMSEQPHHVENESVGLELLVSAQLEPIPPCELSGTDKHYLDQEELVIMRTTLPGHVVSCRLIMVVPPGRQPMPVLDIVLFDEATAWPLIEAYLNQFMIELNRATSKADVSVTIDFTFNCATGQLSEPPLMVFNTVRDSLHRYQPLTLPRDPEAIALSAAISWWLRTTPDI